MFAASGTAAGITGYVLWKSNLKSASARLESALLTERRAETMKLYADKNGGESPEDTLRYYIEALKNHDYKNAATYFLEEKRTAEAESLNKTSEENMKILVGDLEKALSNAGTYSRTGEHYTITDPLLVDFVKLPNGIWKLVEI